MAQGQHPDTGPSAPSLTINNMQTEDTGCGCFPFWLGRRAGRSQSQPERSNQGSRALNSTQPIHFLPPLQKRSAAANKHEASQSNHTEEDPDAFQDVSVTRLDVCGSPFTVQPARNSTRAQKPLGGDTDLSEQGGTPCALNSPFTRPSIDEEKDYVYLFTKRHSLRHQSTEGLQSSHVPSVHTGLGFTGDNTLASYGSTNRLLTMMTNGTSCDNTHEASSLLTADLLEPSFPNIGSREVWGIIREDPGSSASSYGLADPSKLLEGLADLEFLSRGAFGKIYTGEQA